MDGLKVGPLRLNYVPGHEGPGISGDEAREETNQHSSLIAAAQDRLRSTAED